MSQPPRLTDRLALDRQRARAAAGPALFLHHEALAEAQDRLAMVNRRFTDVVIVTPWPQVWRPAFPEARIIPDTEVLDLTEGAADLVIHALCLHWADDPVGQLIQCRRALRPDGLFLGFSLGGQTLHELRAALGEAEIATCGGLSPRILPMAEIRDLGALMQRAGLALPVADSHILKASYETALHLMRDLRAMGEGNALAARHRSPPPKALFLQAAARYAEAFAGADGRVSASFEILTLTGWAPDASQPQPLRPGSATTRLADMLGTREEPLRDGPGSRGD
jgi:SAM-dependent methyltransferase